jgi:hypothetical protein
MGGRVTVLERLAMLVSREPLLEELEIMMDPKDAHIHTMEAWDWDPLARALDEASSAFTCRIKLTMRATRVCAQSDKAFLRLMLRPIMAANLAKRIVVNVSFVAFVGGDACVELMALSAADHISVDRITVANSPNNEIDKICDVLVGSVKEMNFMLRRAHHELLWTCPRFIRALGSIKCVVCESNFEEEENAGTATMLCNTLHLLELSGPNIFEQIAIKSNAPGARLERLILEFAPCNTMMRDPVVMKALRSIKPDVEIIIMGDSMDTGSAAFILQMIREPGRQIGTFWNKNAKQATPVIYARTHLVIRRVMTAMTAMTAMSAMSVYHMPANVQRRFFITRGCSFDAIETEQDMLAMLPEDERMLWML